MKDLVLQGCGTALVTPFTADGAVDYEACAALVDRQVASGVHFLVPLATTGETPTLSQQEKVAIFQTVKAHAAGRPLLVGVGVNSLPDIRQLLFPARTDGCQNLAQRRRPQ